MQLAEVFQIVDGEVITGEMQQEYSSMEPWPLERMKRSRSAHLGLFGLCFRWLRYSTSAISAILWGRPGDRSWLLNGIHTNARMALASSLREGICISCDCFIWMAKIKRVIVPAGARRANIIWANKGGFGSTIAFLLRKTIQSAPRLSPWGGSIPSLGLVGSLPQIVLAITW